ADRRRRERRERGVRKKGEEGTTSEVGGHAEQLQLDDGATSPGVECLTTPRRPDRVPLPELNHGPSANPRRGESGNHRHLHCPRWMTRMRREDRPADDGSRAPLRIARRPKGERVEGDQLERSTDEQAA